MVHPLASIKRLFILWLVAMISLVTEVPPFFFLYELNKGTWFAPLFIVLMICAVGLNILLTGLYFIFGGFSRNMLSVSIRYYGKLICGIIPMSLLIIPLEIFADWPEHIKAVYSILAVAVIVFVWLFILRWTSPEEQEISHQLKKQGINA